MESVNVVSSKMALSVPTTHKQTKTQTRKQSLSHHPVSSSSAPASAQSSAACASAARKQSYR